MTATVSQAVDHGTIVIVYIVEDGRVTPVYFDHRMFWNMAEAEDYRIVGREVVLHEEEDGQRIEFLNG